MFSGIDQPSHWIILAVLVIALFGYKKLPDAARSLGRSLRVFKTEIKGMTEDDAARDAHAHPVAHPVAAAVAGPVAVAAPAAETASPIAGTARAGEPATSISGTV